MGFKFQGTNDKFAKLFFFFFFYPTEKYSEEWKLSIGTHQFSAVFWASL